MQPQPSQPLTSAAPPVRRRDGGLRRRARTWLRQDVPRWLERTFFEPPLAPVCVEIDASHLFLAVARRNKGAARPMVETLRAHPLPPGLVRPSILQPNVSDPPLLAAEVRRLFAGLTPPPAVSVVVPDGSAKVAILELETLPKSRREVLELVRFRLRKTVPFRIDEAQVDFVPLGGSPQAGKVRLLTAVASRPVLEQYQAVVEALGAQAGLVTLSSLALAERCLPPSPPAGEISDILLANVTPHGLTLSVFRGGEMLLFRSKNLPAPHEASAEERRLAARREWQATVAYYQERLAGRGFARAIARLVDWQAADLLEEQDLARLERVDASGWAEPGPGLIPPAGDGARFAPALALALKGAA